MITSKITSQQRPPLQTCFHIKLLMARNTDCLHDLAGGSVSDCVMEQHLILEQNTVYTSNVIRKIFKKLWAEGERLYRQHTCYYRALTRFASPDKNAILYLWADGLRNRRMDERPGRPTYCPSSRFVGFSF